MKLLYQAHSGYARKVLVMAHEIGIADRLEVVHHETSPTRRNETVFAANPLGKVPVLICEVDRRPSALRWRAFADGQTEKLVAAYDFVEREVDWDGPIDLGQIALATALNWIEFRNLRSFRAGRPRLMRWYDAFLQRPSMMATAYSDETND